MSDIITRDGEIIRIVDESLAYVMLLDKRIVVPFVHAALADYRGQSFEERNLHEGSSVEVVLRSSTGTIESIKPKPRQGADRKLRTIELSDPARAGPKLRTIELPDPEPGRRDGTPQEQIVLHPEMLPKTTIRASRAINPKARAFGKLVDCSTLRPGDLLLSQDIKPDGVSKLIAQVQLDGGYSKDDARWSHAAMYLGDNANVIEATFENVLAQGSVRITSLDEYAQGKHVLRFRRSRYVQTDQEGWFLCVRALVRLGRPYSFAHAAKLWWDVVIRKIGFYDEDFQRPTSKAVICSTLYADAYNEATRRRLGEIAGVCVPAWLSVSEEFDDVAASWGKLL